MKKIQIYDEEVYPNLFLIVFKDVSTSELSIFEISPRRDDRHLLLAHLKQLEIMIGFNNLRFDSPLLHLFLRLYQRNLKGNKLVGQLYKKGQQLIKNKNAWSNMVRNPKIRQQDLFLTNHYDNPAKATSLKILEFNMKMTDIQTLPYPFDKVLTHDEIQKVVNYCIHDVNATEKFYSYNIENIGFRDKMSSIYRQDLMNYNDVKIGGVILLKALSHGMRTSEYEIKKMSTHRKAMKVSDIIFDYINFDSLELNILLTWWKKRIIYETKGQFNKLPLDEVQELLPFCNNELEKGKLKNLNIIYNKFQFDFGTGGLHGACYPGVFRSDEEGDLKLIDVSSYYTNLAYHNRLHPKHIPQGIFGAVIKQLYDLRMKAKDEGDDTMVKAIKLALNGYLYGNSNNEHSFMYDPQFMMTICINGQLLLTMLAEKCMDSEIKVIQVNTDGILVKCPKHLEPRLNEIMKEWMELTKLKLDVDNFDLVVQRDVNNYLARYTDGKIKYKGAFDFEYEKNGDWHKNFSMLVVAKALKAYFVDGVPIEKFIKDHNDPYDFFLRTKYNKLTRLVERTYDMQGNLQGQKLLQNVTRYYVSKSGKEFIKIMNPLKGKTEDREFKVEAGYKCTEMNKVTKEGLKLMKQDLNYDYYIAKIQQIVDLVEDYIPEEDLSFIIIDDV